MGTTLKYIELHSDLVREQLRVNSARLLLLMLYAVTGAILLASILISIYGVWTTTKMVFAMLGCGAAIIGCFVAAIDLDHKKAHVRHARQRIQQFSFIEEPAHTPAYGACPVQSDQARTSSSEKGSHANEHMERRHSRSIHGNPGGLDTRSGRGQN